jgi:RNA polymerase sigma factor (sigma-70 family)
MAPNSKDAFGDVLRRHGGIIHRIAHAYTGQASDRADLTQEIAGALWRSWPGFDPSRGSVTTWMYRTALNVAISSLRSRTRQARHLAPLDVADQAPELSPVNHERAEQVRQLHRIIAELPELDRALMLLYLDEQSTREIAEVLGLSETNVTTRLSRLRQRIRDRFTHDDGRAQGASDGTR